jgi:hypothetical protein
MLSRPQDAAGRAARERSIAVGIEIITQALRKRRIIVGAGTSGRLGESAGCRHSARSRSRRGDGWRQDALLPREKRIANEQGASRFRLKPGHDVVIGVSSGMTKFVSGGLTRARQAGSKSSSSLRPARRDGDVRDLMMRRRSVPK